MSTHNADSKIQRLLEPVALQIAAKDLQVNLPEKKRINLGDKNFLEIDGFSAGEPPTYFEVYVSLDKPKGGQQHKLKADALKLIYIAGKTPGQKVLVVTSSEAKAWLLKGWLGMALNEFGVKVHLVQLESQHIESLKMARSLQKHANVAKG